MSLLALCYCREKPQDLEIQLLQRWKCMYNTCEKYFSRRLCSYQGVVDKQIKTKNPTVIHIELFLNCFPMAELLYSVYNGCI